MKNIALVLVAGMLLSPLCRAQVRWCNVTGHGNGDRITYPPIARAASVSGTVLSRVTYSPQGDVKEVTSVFGPVLLTTPVVTQLKNWHVKTSASGNELCQSLAIIDFRIGSSASAPTRPTPQSMFRISVVAEPLVLYMISDPAPRTISRRKRFFLF